MTSSTVPRAQATPQNTARTSEARSRFLFSVSFVQALLEALVLALGLSSLAWLWTRTGTPSPWPELLAFAGEHSLWSWGALRLRRSKVTGGGWRAAWRVLRAPIWGLLAGLGFAVGGRELALLVGPTRPFFEFQSLAVPDPRQVLGANFGTLVLTVALRFVFVYAFRAVWLEGRASLRWRLTALALGGGVLASGIVALLPNLVALVRDPARQLTGEALREARDLAVALEPSLRFGTNDEQIRNLMEYLTTPSRPRLTQLDPDPAEPELRPTLFPADRVALVLDPSGLVVASTNPERLYVGQTPMIGDPAWAEVRAAAATGRCRAVPLGDAVLAGCPASGPGLEIPGARTWLLAAVLRPTSNSSAPFADLAAQVTHDLTLMLDTLSQAFLPIFLGLGLIGYLGAKRLTGPLEHLLSASKSLEAGQINARVSIEGEDEIARLGQGFNAMAGRLESNIEALEQSKNHVEALLRANRTLTASASHELRTPLAVMRAHLESASMRHTHLGPEELRVLEGEVGRLEKLVEDLFALSRAELGQLELHLAPVNVSDILRHLHTALKPLASSTHISLVDTIPTTLPRVSADRERLTQALLNLAQNALRYTPEGGLVKLEAARVQNTVQLSVSDTGIGITPEELEHIFEPFYRTDPARTRATGGGGLGLALVREYVEAMHGSVHAESQVGRGSRFTITLPIWNDPRADLP